jgi:hypothetical protein
MKKTSKPLLITIAQGSALCSMSPQLFAKRVARGDVRLVRRLPKKVVRLDDVLKYSKTATVGAPKFRKRTAASTLFSNPLCLRMIRANR